MCIKIEHINAAGELETRAELGSPTRLACDNGLKPRPLTVDPLLRRTASGLCSIGRFGPILQHFPLTGSGRLFPSPAPDKCLFSVPAPQAILILNRLGRIGRTVRAVASKRRANRYRKSRDLIANSPNREARSSSRCTTTCTTDSRRSSFPWAIQAGERRATG